MKNIYVLEHFDFNTEQYERMKKLGNLFYFDGKITEDQIGEAIQNADVILLDWIDPTDIIAKMKKGSFICLPYTGCSWIKSIITAIEQGVIISNTPNYSTNAVAEHCLSLMLSVAKHIPFFNKETKTNTKVPFNKSVELNNKTVGIIGLGRIGLRLAELLKPFNVKILTYNRSPKGLENIKDEGLPQLLKESDFVCVTCALNDKTKNMIGKTELSFMKDDAILIQTTGGIVDLFALDDVLNQGKLFGVGLDDVDQLIIPEGLYKQERLICTYHRAYDTKESEFNRINICIDNIEAYINNKPINQIKV